MSKFEVTFEPEGNRIHVDAGSLLSDAAAHAGIVLALQCGGKGTCGKCKVQIVDDGPEASRSERALLGKAAVEAGFRLACQTKVDRNMKVVVPVESRLEDASQILSSSGLLFEGGAPEDLPVRKHYVELAAPTLEDDRPDMQRLSDAVGAVHCCLDVVREVPPAMRDHDFKGTAVIVENQLIDFEPGDTTDQVYALAFDIGTTTVVGVLVDLTTGKDVATVSRMNPQTRYGDDVLSRIQRVRETENGLQELHQGLIDALNEMVDELEHKGLVPPEQVYAACFAGNTTMQSLLTGVSPAPLGEIPFVAAARQSCRCSARELGLHIHPRGRILVFPVIGGFVGGDTVAGLLTTEMEKADVPTLLVDIGTNGELVLKHEGKLLAASTAAGPAFEGANIRHGMRATRGAIEKVAIEDGELHFDTIGHTPPVGLCGSALIDATGELLRRGILSPQGQLLQGEDLPADLSPALRERVVDGEDGPEFIIAKTSESGTEAPVTVTHRDFRSLQLGTGAIRAGIAILLRQAGLAPNALGKVYVAGAFGNYIRPHNAQRMGLLPHQIELAKIEFVGNTSLGGAKQAALSLAARERAEALGLRAQHVELSQDPNFQMEYMEAMFFPMEEPV